MPCDTPLTGSASRLQAKTTISNGYCPRSEALSTSIHPPTHQTLPVDSGLAEALHWFVERVRQLMRGSHQQWIPVLVHAGSRGLGAATAPPNRVKVMGGILASALFNVNDPTMVPNLVAAGRYAASDLDPFTRLDPLPDAIEGLLASLEPAIGYESAARYLMRLFSATDPSDRRTVTAIIIGAR